MFDWKTLQRIKQIYDPLLPFSCNYSMQINRLANNAKNLIASEHFHNLPHITTRNHNVFYSYLGSVHTGTFFFPKMKIFFSICAPYLKGNCCRTSIKLLHILIYFFHCVYSQPRVVALCKCPTHHRLTGLWNKNRLFE